MAERLTHSTHCFTAEISKIMYVCGDCMNPSAESAAMVEEITRQQVIQLAVRAAECAKAREGAETEAAVTVEDVLFLMRKDKRKLTRVLYQIEFRAMARRTSSTREEAAEDDDSSRAGGGRNKLSLDLDFLNDEFGSDFYSTDEANALQLERLACLDSRTRGMNSAEYTTYVECRQTSFNKNVGKFREWLSLQSATGQRPAHNVMEVLGYLAYDTVRELVELSLLVKEDMMRGQRDIISSRHLILPSSHHPTLPSSPPPTSPSPHSPHKNPNPSPTSSPTASEVSQQKTSEPAAGAVTRNSRGRKRKRSVAETAGVSERRESTSEQPQGSTVPDTSQHRTGTEGNRRGIQPVHIREAMRRLSVPSGPSLPLATHYSKPSFTKKTICL